MDFQIFALVMLFLACVEQSLASCVVDSFTVKDDFDPKRYAGKWYALQKKDPEGLFLQDNISAEYTVGDDGAMVATSRGRVTLFGFWVVCADMAAQYSVVDPGTPGKMFMNYQGLASYLSSGGDNYWVIDTDYDNYAITYACRTLKDDGSCEDGYSLVFSRNPRGLPAAIQRTVRRKQEEICMAGEFQPVLQSGMYSVFQLNGQTNSERVLAKQLLSGSLWSCSSSYSTDHPTQEEDRAPLRDTNRTIALL
ncbi:hypothetical protein L3Q82_022813 [Scortum barcoo]|uniref:Uncharacterized protein n=1 Tax=Scortum barcoo TaxID=214431 RepID=A0ACB8WXI0_9TELE|nr:hypothetical protein L3Q82_022813 [Scortum barcoo]